MGLFDKLFKRHDHHDHDHHDHDHDHERPVQEAVERDLDPVDEHGSSGLGATAVPGKPAGEGGSPEN
jgi:hypothetical protein